MHSGNLGPQSSSKSGTESRGHASPTLPRLLHPSLGSFSLSFLISFPGNTILLHFLALHPLYTPLIHLGVLWVEEIPRGCLSTSWSKLQFGELLILFKVGKSLSIFIPKLHLSEKRVFVLKAVGLPEPPPWLFVLLCFPW